MISPLSILRDRQKLTAGRGNDKWNIDVFLGGIWIVKNIALAVDLEQ